MGDLVEYYGTECKHCIEMMPLIEKLEKEHNVKIERKETWHNSANKAEFEKTDNGKCGGVPFFFNKKTKKTLCGSVPYEDLVKWALGK